MSTDPLDNNGRAGFAAAALATYYDETRDDGSTYGDEGSEDFNDAFSDLLGDMQHLAKRAGLNFGELLERGTGHFEEEVREEAEVERAHDEAVAFKNAPIDEQVYAAITDDFQHFFKFRGTSGLSTSEIRWSLLRLKEQGKIEHVPGKGWRRVTVPLPERILAELTDEPVYIDVLEERLHFPAAVLREDLVVLQEAGKAKLIYGQGWRRAASDG